MIRTSHIRLLLGSGSSWLEGSLKAGASQKETRAHNRGLVRDALERGLTAAPEIAEEVGLNKATVQLIFKQMLEEGEVYRMPPQGKHDRAHRVALVERGQMKLL